MFFERTGIYFSELLHWSLNLPFPFGLLLMFFIFFHVLLSLHANYFVVLSHLGVESTLHGRIIWNDLKKQGESLRS